MKNKIYVVEGKNDITRLKQIFPNINVVSVNGSAINKDVVNMLIEKNKKHKIVLCLDPDYPGMKIRNYLESKLTNVSHIFIEQKDAHNKNFTKIGLEHASEEVIRKAFEKEIGVNVNLDSDVTIDFLVDNKIIGDYNSKEIRDMISKELNIGYVNGKQFLSRVNKFGITKQDIEKIIKSEK